MSDPWKAVTVAAIWAGPAIGILVTGESSIAWAWFLSYWATQEITL